MVALRGFERGDGGARGGEAGAEVGGGEEVGVAGAGEGGDGRLHLAGFEGLGGEGSGVRGCQVGEVVEGARVGLLFLCFFWGIARVSFFSFGLARFWAGWG